MCVVISRVHLCRVHSERRLTAVLFSGPGEREGQAGDGRHGHSGSHVCLKRCSLVTTTSKVVYADETVYVTG